MSRRRMGSWVVAVSIGVTGCLAADRSASPERMDLPAAADVVAEAAATKPAPSAGALVARLATDRVANQPLANFASMVIRTGQVSIRVDSLEPAIRRLGEIAAAAGGHLANSSIQTGDQSPRSGTLEIKVPADRYKGAVDRMSEVGRVISSSTSAQDVGEEFVDVTARTDNARRLEARLLGLLSTRTGKLEEVLGVERELARVREEIERYEGRLRWLRSQVAMSTLTVTVFEPGPLVGSPGENVIVNAFKESWRNFVAVVAGGIAVAGGLVPVILLVGLVGVAGRALWRRFRRSGPLSVEGA